MYSAQLIKDRISLVLEEKGITANKMLVDLGLNRSLFLDMSRKNSVPSADKIGVIADYLGVSTDYLLGRAEKKDINR